MGTIEQRIKGISVLIRFIKRFAVCDSDDSSSPLGTNFLPPVKTIFGKLR